MDCQATGNPKTGEALAKWGVMVGNDQANARAGVFAATPGTGGPVTKGVYGAVNANGHGLSVQHGHIEGMGSTTTASAQANLLQSQHTALNATGYHSHSRTHDQFGAGLNMQTSAGHSAALGVNRVPQFDVTTMQATGSANLYTSPSGNLNLSANGNAMRHMSGPRRGKSDFGGGVNLRYNF
ncbi:LOW QUALITY PROTEIN: attacin-A [Drosophila obscura]|uniref:LOW QUALITY PROTEIN: attacin-A n=1 Tax=Drosophila obscura TaxID=7282 RepID=UPI001BB15EEB|nr:LOW QUALITY PROTEIN: attacin-A [Drosophila obscura]